jgi:hypothetical protein
MSDLQVYPLWPTLRADMLLSVVYPTAPLPHYISVAQLSSFISGGGIALPLSIAQGGTGATSADGALTALGAAPLASPTFTGAPSAPTPLPSDNSTHLATTAFVVSVTGSPSWDNIINKPATFPPTLPIAEAGVTGLITDLAAKAPLASPAFTGTPTAPTAGAGDNSTRLATTAFVTGALSASAGVASFNTRTGVVSLTAADLSGVGGALLASPALTGTPTAPTAGTSDSSTRLATTAYVQTAIAAISGTSITTSATPPSSPAPGNLWWSTADGEGQLFIYYTDADSSSWVIANAPPVSTRTEFFTVAVSDETTAITTGVAKTTFRMPFALTLSEMRASLSTAFSSGIPTIDVNEGGVSIFSTRLTIDAGEKTSTTAAAAAVISDTALADDAEITIDIDVAGTGARGLKVTFLGTR